MNGATVAQHQHNGAMIRPIETRAFGHRFRSRLEARWAVFFETLGVRWEYEPEGFDLDGTPYLPDFRVTTGDLVFWYEIKPPGSDDCQKFHKFTDLMTGGDDCSWNLEFRLLRGDPYCVFSSQLKSECICPRCGRSVTPEHYRGGDVGFLCYPCDLVTTDGGGNPWEVGFAGTPFHPHKGWIMTTEGDFQVMLFKLQKACFAARRARFEHGESPQ